MHTYLSGEMLEMLNILVPSQVIFTDCYDASHCMFAVCMLYRSHDHVRFLQPVPSGRSLGTLAYDEAKKAIVGFAEEQLPDGICHRDLLRIVYRCDYLGQELCVRNSWVS